MSESNIKTCPKGHLKTPENTGKRYHCRACQLDINKEYYLTRAEKIAARKRAHHIAHPEVLMYQDAKKRAKRDSVPFSIELKDIIVPNICPLLGIPIFVGPKKHTRNSPTLDRIIPALGYVKSNIWVVSHRANAIKRDASLEEMETIVSNWKALTEISKIRG